MGGSALSSTKRGKILQPPHLVGKGKGGTTFFFIIYQERKRSKANK